MQTNWIGGTAVRSAGSGGIDVINPAREESIDAIPQGSREDAEAAVAAAKSAARAWGRSAPAQRRKALRAAAARLAARRDDIARLLTLENGKPLSDSGHEVDACVDITLAFAELVVHARSGLQGGADAELIFQNRDPRGVAACITPWNYPLAVAIECVVPNLAAGNTVVWKPSEKTPLACRLMGEVMFADLPPGVFNIVLGDGRHAGEALVSHPDVAVVVFVGSERTGRHIAGLCGPDLRKCVLELGGKDPFIVDETVDPDAAAKLAASAAYTNAGQICTSTERLYVHRKVFDPFCDALVRHSGAIRVGDGLEPETQMGPLVDDLQLGKVVSHVDAAVAGGAEIRCGGARPNRVGYFYPPTVVTGIDHGMALMTEETFGPIAPVMPFDDFDEAIALANDCRYGLGAIVCTTSAPRAMQAIREIQAGMVKVNTNRGKAPGATSEPYKGSGTGHGYGIEFLFELTRQKSVHWRPDLG
jgi:acyl-CoA reductase-like NAD-dependent aldehyde dehydrogenase